jgi:DNA-binding NtrC family response regulator
MAEQMKYLVVCVDDDETLVTAVGRSLRREPTLDVRLTCDPHEALAWIGSDQVAVLVSDYDMPEMTGAKLAGFAKQLRPETVRILLTGQRTQEAAVDGINQGEIFRFVAKPFEDRALRAIVIEATQRHEELLALSGDRQRRARREALREALESEYPGISVVPAVGVIEVTSDPWGEAVALGLPGLDGKMET